MKTIFTVTFRALFKFERENLHCFIGDWLESKLSNSITAVVPFGMFNVFVPSASDGYLFRSMVYDSFEHRLKRSSILPYAARKSDGR